MDEDRLVAERSRENVEYLARELAAIRISVGELATRDFLRSELGHHLEQVRKELER